MREAPDKKLDQQIDGEEIGMQRLRLRHCQRVKILDVTEEGGQKMAEPSNSDYDDHIQRFSSAHFFIVVVTSRKTER